MLDKILEIKDKAIDRIKNVGLVRGIEIGSGIAVILGAIAINFLADDDLMATDIVENYDPDIIEVDDIVVEDSTDSNDETE